MDDWDAEAYDRWLTTPPEEEVPLDCYHPGRKCDRRCDPDNDGDAERNGDFDDYE